MPEKNVSRLSFIGCLSTLAALLGCAVPNSNLNTGNVPVESLRPGYEIAYRPQLEPGKTLNAAIAELGSNLKRSNGIWICLEDDYLKCGRSTFIRNLDFSGGSGIQIAHTPTFTDEGKKSFSFFNYHLLNSDIVVESAKGSGSPLYFIIFPEAVSFRTSGAATAQKLADVFFLIQQNVKAMVEKQNKQLSLFEPVAAQYRALAVKPPVSEEQRRLIVQANALTEQKKYRKAFEQYQKVIELDPTSFPGAYYNMALLGAQENAPVSAVFYMKHYLLLVPEAADARSAKDKIYEWEFMVRK
jgi:tetratricopeptide (TPR) repeat protein